MCDGCSDNGFIDFRDWLIAQGLEVYMAALKDPDSLADIPAYGGYCFEFLSYAGDSVYEKLTGCSSYDTFDRNAYWTLIEELKRTSSMTRVSATPIPGARAPPTSPGFVPNA